MEKTPIRQKTVVEQVMREIQDLIASGKYKINEKIPGENELAAKFGVSRPTIREAIKIFSYLGILISHSGRGTYVGNQSTISTEALTWVILLGQNEAAEMIELREIIESRCIEKIVAARKEKSSAELIQKLGDCVEKMKTAAKQKSLQDLKELDFEFHWTIINGAGNSLFSAMYDTLRSFMKIEIEQTQGQIKDYNHIVETHRGILEGIASGKVSKAVEGFRNHMTSPGFQIFK